MKIVLIFVLSFIASCQQTDKISDYDINVQNSLTTFVDYLSGQNDELLQEIKEKNKNAGKPLDYKQLENKATRFVEFQSRILRNQTKSTEQDPVIALIKQCKNCQVELLSSYYANTNDSTLIIINRSKILILINQALIDITEKMFRCDWKSYPEHRRIQYQIK